MPVWHANIKSLADQGKVQMLGVTQEQHADRCRLFAQWHKIGWPILHDPINFLGSRGVPTFVAIDEHGVVRNTQPTLDWMTTFVNTDSSPPDKRPAKLSAAAPDLDHLRQVANTRQTIAAWQSLGDAAILWGGESELHTAIDAYSAAQRLAPKDGNIEFRLGVAYRMRYDMLKRRPDDFQAAVDHWSRALELQPNQYIFRRRIQQYGPRLIKPYPFYDWVRQAQSEIIQRGEPPIELSVLPSGAEVAHPARDFVSSTPPAMSPDPIGRIARDEADLIQVSAVIVPAKIQPGESARVYLGFRPSEIAAWNNEAEPLRVWLEDPAGWKLQQQLLDSGPLPRAPESYETRLLEFEIQAPEVGTAAINLRGYALYYVCEKEIGMCLYRRQDFEVPVNVSKR